VNNREEYEAFLERLPRPGGGGAHRAIFAAACHGARAGLSQEQVCADLRAKLPKGTREVSDREIEEGVAAGFADVHGATSAERPRRPPPLVAPGTFERMVERGRGVTAADIAARSPVPVVGEPWETACQLMEALYRPEELLFVGDDQTPGRLGVSIRSAGEWAALVRQRKAVPWPKVMPNPLTGKAASKRSGEGTTLRGDACVAAHRFAVLEMDAASIEDQLAFWAVAKLPLAALVHSGGKSLHGWVRVDCRDAAEWEREVESTLFPRVFEPMGFDGACKNEARLSRLAGHVRVDKGAVQRLLWLAPEGKAVGL